MVEAKARQVRALRTRALIVQTAAIAFAQHGFEGVSLNDLVEASGLSKGAFYHHFASKQEVALATFRAKQEELIERLFEGAPLSTGIAERVAALLRRRAELVVEDPSLRCVLRLGNELNVRSGPGSEYGSFHDLALERIADLVAQGQRSAEIRAELDPAGVARAIFAWIVGVDTLSLMSSDGKDLEERSDEMLSLLIPALTPTASRTTEP